MPVFTSKESLAPSASEDTMTKSGWNYFGHHSQLHFVEAWQYSGSRCAESNVSVLTQMVTLPLYIPSSFICCLTKESAEGKEHIFNLHLQMIQ